MDHRHHYHYKSSHPFFVSNILKTFKKCSIIYIDYRDIFKNKIRCSIYIYELFFQLKKKDESFQSVNFLKGHKLHHDSTEKHTHTLSGSLYTNELSDSQSCKSSNYLTLSFSNHYTHIYTLTQEDNNI